MIAGWLQVRERESGSKQMQFISGVGPLPYWLAHWAWDWCMYTIITGCVLVIFAAENQKGFTGSAEAFGGTLLLLLGFGWAVLPLSSAASFRFSTPSSALIAMIAFHFLTGFGLVTLTLTRTLTPAPTPTPTLSLTPTSTPTPTSTQPYP